MLGTTPMFLQYKEIKDQYVDMILFYRLGDFYEMFDQDAVEASEILGLALTARDGGNNIKVPMCGVPYHAAEMYIKKLIAAGKKVAICEQTEDPKAVKGLVRREVIRIVTPGMVLEDTILEAKSNYIVCVVGKKEYGLAIADVSTGEFLTTQLKGENSLLCELAKYAPVECVMPDDNSDLYALMKRNDTELYNMSLSPYSSYLFKEQNAREKLLKHFEINDLSVLNLMEGPQDKLAIIASAALLGYIEEMLRIEPKHFLRLDRYTNSNTMQLDLFTKKNLELVDSLNNHHGVSLFDIMNKTSTSAGARLLRRWLEAPLINQTDIKKRLEATEELYKNHALRVAFNDDLKNINDIERITSRISCASANPRDLVSLKNSLRVLPNISKLLQQCENPLFQEFALQFDTLDDVVTLIEQGILDEPSYQIRDGKVIRPTYNDTLFELTKIMTNVQDWLDQYVEQEREATGIKKLKIGYNKVFGYYLDVTKSYQHLVPDHYIRKQTLANSERYITEALKEMEDKILTANEKVRALEAEIFNQIIATLQLSIDRMLRISQMLAKIDIFVSFGRIAAENNYCKPQLKADELAIEGLRHPVIEQQANLGEFTPNDVFFTKDEQRFMIITGPNMSGKSTYCRSVALAAIMSQVGSFVPATQCQIKIFDRVFARIGASDYLAGGQSTFMVEMNEVATITNNATRDSLVILDEVGRGTSTYDGLALATSITKYINERIHACTLFATHYHELTLLERDRGIVNYTVSVFEDEKDIIFLHKIVPGSANKSYGIHVAKKAGIPQEIVQLANVVLSDLETDAENEMLRKDYELQELPVVQKSQLEEELSALQIEDMTMREMANALADFVEKARQ